MRDEDIKWWWNLDGVERMMMLKVDELHRLVLFKKTVEEDGKTNDEAGAVVRKYHPIYGNPEDTTHTQGDDRPIPEELKDRINIYVEKRFTDNSEKFKKEIEQSSTFNALIRKEVRNNNL